MANVYLVNPTDTAYLDVNAALQDVAPLSRLAAVLTGAELDAFVVAHPDGLIIGQAAAGKSLTLAGKILRDGRYPGNPV